MEVNTYYIKGKSVFIVRVHFCSAKTRQRFVGNQWPFACFKIRSQWGKKAEYEPVSTLTSQTLEAGYINTCLGCFQHWPYTRKGFVTVTTKQGLGSFCVGVFYWYLSSCFCCWGCVGLWSRTCKVICTLLCRIMLQTLKSILSAPSLSWLAGVSLSLLQGSVRNWKTGHQWLTHVFSCHSSSLENDLKFHL